MTTKIECVLLIDDSPEDNYYHKLIIEESGKFNKINTVKNGIEALEYLKNENKYQDKSLFPKPSIIFLDINMPRMNGFEFMSEYAKIEESKKAEICIIMLSTSKNPDHVTVANNYKELSDFFVKPLDTENINKAILLYKQKIDSSSKVNVFLN